MALVADKWAHDGKGFASDQLVHVPLFLKIGSACNYSARVLRVHPGQQPGVQFQQLSQALEALHAESVGRWSVTVATHRRVQVPQRAY